MSKISTRALSVRRRQSGVAPTLRAVLDRVTSKVSARALSLRKRQSEADPTLPALLEFQWPSTAVVNAPVPRSARGIVWVVASMVFVLVTTLGMISTDVVVTARGTIVSKSATILVQPLETAIVRAINVHEGQKVRAGQLLARLDPTFAAADLATLTAQVSSLQAEVARLRAESKGEPFTYAGTDPHWILQASIYKNRKAEFTSKLQDYQHRIDELAAQTSRAQSDAAGYRERLSVAANIEQMRKKLESMKSGSRLNTLIATDSRAEMARSLANAEATVNSSNLNQAALESNREAFIQGWKADVSQQLVVANGKLNDAQEQLNKAKLRRKLVELHSEVDGIVQSVAKVSVGSVLQPGQQFLTLVPEGATLEVEGNISGGDIGFVHVDDPVVIKFDTFPYSQYGVAHGTVRIVSPDSFTAQAEARNPTGGTPVPASVTEPFYRTRIAIDRVELHHVPAGFHIIPGMPVTADIKVGKRTILQYLLDVMLRVPNEAMREP
jgi:membrane fusion protein, hemolysin D